MGKDITKSYLRNACPPETASRKKFQRGRIFIDETVRTLILGSTSKQPPTYDLESGAILNTIDNNSSLLWKADKRLHISSSKIKVPDKMEQSYPINSPRTSLLGEQTNILSTLKNLKNSLQLLCTSVERLNLFLPVSQPSNYKLKTQAYSAYDLDKSISISTPSKVPSPVLPTAYKVDVLKEEPMVGSKTSQVKTNKPPHKPPILQSKDQSISMEVSEEQLIPESSSIVVCESKSEAGRKAQNKKPKEMLEKFSARCQEELNEIHQIYHGSWP
ncbi:UNVERIFIED_CONTAM: hypothetical protein K2H54_053152 [Gekko kuhli]